MHFVILGCLLDPGYAANCQVLHNMDIILSKSADLSGFCPYVTCIGAQMSNLRNEDIWVFCHLGRFWTPAVQLTTNFWAV